MKKISLIAVMLSLANVCFSWQVNLVKKIPFDEGALFVSTSFVVLEDGKFLFTDIRDKNFQLKVFNQDGKLIRAWGRMGPGPDEFVGLGCLDYKSPYIAVTDAGKHRIHVFEKLQDYEVKKIGEILSWEMNNQIKIYEQEVLICGYIVSPKGRKYILFKRDFNGRKTNYILPLEHAHGARSLTEHKKIAEEVSGISAIAFFDIYKDIVFYVSDVRLRIVKINLKSNKIDFLGKETKNFRPLVMNKKTREELLQPETGKKISEELLTKHSYVSGIFANENFFGVIYVNREKKIGDNLYFVPYVQIYDHSGKFLHEQQLSEVISDDRIIPFFYQKEIGCLYLLPLLSVETTYKYVIYKFAIEQ